MKYIRIGWLLMLFIGCVTKDYKSNTKTYFHNITSHKIEVLPYLDGMVSNADYKQINPYEHKMVLEMNVYGRTLSPDFGTLLQPYDSVVVVFDDSIQSTHLKFNTSIQTGHYIFYDSLRAISNPNNYIKTVEYEHEKYLVGYFTYTFSEQDYLDAKN